MFFFIIFYKLTNKYTDETTQWMIVANIIYVINNG